ncbi:hypothetical protein OPT61_g3961 [Boeremia exigua]|uniref:Uncharacterized protein n=1 Tax=Boeremia exigua TaxID=749465 RepID=A0ACC2IFR9_9PLEO|nr:hypothetical protein OPT61_g3961 [Boeremia exigua]
MGKHADDDVSVSVHSVDGPWTPNRSRTWGNDVVETKNKRLSWAWTWGFRNRWTSVKRSTEQLITPAVQSAKQTAQPVLLATWLFMSCRLWPFVVRAFTAKGKWIALSLFLSGAVTPMALLGYFTPRQDAPVGTYPYTNIFAAKTMECGTFYLIDSPENSTITGIEGLFVLDRTWGRFSFATVKTIDVVWDIFVGRGAQLFAWWVAYIVFSDALLRVIERHPASFRIFQRIALEGPSLLSLWTLCLELFSSKSKRTKALFAYLLLSTSYVLCIPMFLGAMTGYDSTSIAWIDLDGTNNIVPTSELRYSWVIEGTVNSTFEKPVCEETDGGDLRGGYIFPRLSHCTCQRLDGSLAAPGTFATYNDYGLIEGRDNNEKGTPCFFNYPGSNGTWSYPGYYDSSSSSSWNKTFYCNETVTYKINDQQYDVQMLQGKRAFCYNGKDYDFNELTGRSRCLPDTTNPSYQWGFSTMLSGVFVFIHFGWSISMYIVWLDAQSRSALIREGYQMTPLRAAFAIAKAVKRKTGLGEKQLVRHNTKDLNKELDGTRGKKGTTIDYSIFVPDPEDDADDERAIRRRRALALDGLPS